MWKHSNAPTQVNVQYQCKHRPSKHEEEEARVVLSKDEHNTQLWRPHDYEHEAEHSRHERASADRVNLRAQVHTERQQSSYGNNENAQRNASYSMCCRHTRSSEEETRVILRKYEQVWQLWRPHDYEHEAEHSRDHDERASVDPTRKM